MIVLALLVSWFVVYGTGRQIGHDARVGLATARQRAAARSAKIRTDKRAPAWKRRTVTAAHYTGKVTGATFRGVRYVGASAASGARWGIAEGRKRHAEREELQQATPLADSDVEQRVTYRQVRDRILHDRAERAGKGVPARKVRRIEKRDAAEDERHGEQVRATEPEPEPEPTCDGTCTNSDGWQHGRCGTCDGRGELVWNFGYEHGHTPCPACNPNGQRWKRARVDRAVADNQPDTAPADDSNITTAPAYEPEPQHINGSSNGGTTMTAPASNGFRASGEATTISGARAAWASFEGYAVEMFDTAGQAEQEAKQRTEGAAQMLDVATAAETDAKQQMTAAQTLAASLADSDMGDPQAVADAQQQQEYAAGLAQAAAELRTEAEGIQASAANQAQLAEQLRSLAETSQSHAAGSLQGLNERNARREAFFKD